MKNTLALLVLGLLSACTTTRVDDHSYHHNDTPPAQNITYSTTVIKRVDAPAPPRPTFQQQDQEYIQYQQEPPARQSSYVVPSTYNYAPTTYNNYAAPVAYYSQPRPQIGYCAQPTYYPRPQPVYCRPQYSSYSNCYRQPVMQVSYNRPNISFRARFQP